MKDLTKIYIDLSKCTEEQIKSLALVIQRANKLHDKAFDYMTKVETLDVFTCLAETNLGKWTLWNKNAIFNKTELTYPEFIKLFEGGEEEKEIENIKDIAHTEGVLVGLKICKELWAQGTISHETIQEEIYHYQEELENLNSNQ